MENIPNHKELSNKSTVNKAFFLEFLIVKLCSLHISVLNITEKS